MAIASDTDTLEFHNSVRVSGFLQRDARLEERVRMDEKDIADWTDAIEKK